MDRLSTELSVERTARTEAEEKATNMRERMRHMEESMAIMARQLERVQADKRTTDVEVLALRGSCSESNARMREAQVIATNALSAASALDSRISILLKERDVQIKQSVVQSTKIALVKRAVAFKESKSQSEMLIIAGLTAAVAHLSGSHPRLAEHCAGLLNIMGKAAFKAYSKLQR